MPLESINFEPLNITPQGLVEYFTRVLGVRPHRAKPRGPVETRRDRIRTNWGQIIIESYHCYLGRVGDVTVMAIYDSQEIGRQDVSSFVRSANIHLKEVRRKYGPRYAQEALAS